MIPEAEQAIHFQLVAETLRRRCYTASAAGLITPKIASSQTPLERLPYLDQPASSVAGSSSKFLRPG
jgi:hypothetical protein